VVVAAATRKAIKKGKRFSRGNGGGDFITLLVKIFKLNLEFFIIVSLKTKVYIN